MGERPRWLDRAEYPFESRFVDIDGNDVHYIDEGAGPLLLFVHAGPAWSFIHRRVIARLRDEFRCVAIDFPMSGPSRASSAYRPTLRAASEVFDAFVRRLDLRDAALVVHDLGAPVALGASVRMLERFGSIAVIEAFAWPLTARHPRVVRMLRLVSSRPFVIADDVFRILDRVQTSPFGAGHGLTASGRAVFTAPYREASVRHAALAMLGDAARDADFLTRLDRALPALSSLPALLVFGEKSPARDEHFADAWSDRFADARLIVVPGAHHFPMTDAPDLVASAVRSWSRECARRLLLASSSSAVG